MESIALYIGYIIIGLIAVALICLSLLVVCGTIIGLYRTIKYKQTSRLIRKYETRNMYKACKIATKILISKGVSEENTLKEAQDMIEKYRKRYKLHRIEK